MILMDFLEQLPPPQLFVATLVCGAIVATIVLVVVRLAVNLLRVPTAEPLAVRDGLITSLSAIFALMVAFSAAGIWSDAIQARAAVQREANSLENIYALASGFPSGLREQVRDAILAAGQRTIERDWPAMRRRPNVNEALFDRANSPIVALIAVLSQNGDAAKLPNSDVIVTQLIELRSARIQREMIARGGVSAAQWTAMIAIPIAALVLIALAYNHDLRLRLAMAGIFVFGVCSALFVILAHDRPFVGYLGVEPIPIEQALQRIKTASSTGGTFPLAAPNTPPATRAQ
jgi:Protein of unknown function (DUF4239)